MAEMKNYMAMAQQAGPREATPEDQAALQEAAFTDEDFTEMGMPTGNTPEAMKQRVIEMLERFDLLEGISATEKMRIMQEVDRLIQDMVNGNFEAAEKNPVNEMLVGAEQKLGELTEGMEEEDAA